MMTSNNSPLLKGSQKTKGTIWKPLIAISSLSIFSFISGQYLSYVIVAVSGSGAIAAVPLAIFAVSTVVALISTIYLIRLAVSRADNKKEEPQKFVCENCTNLENEPTEKEFDKSVKQDNKLQTEVEDKSNVSTPTPPPVTFGTQPSPSVSAPPSPPPIPTTQSPPVTLGTQLNPSVSAPPPPPPFGAPPPPLPPPPPPFLGNNFPSGPATDAGMVAEMKSKTLKKTDSFAAKPGGHKETSALFAEIKKGKNLMSKEERDKIEKKRLKEQEAKKSSNKGGGQQEKQEDLMADLNKTLQKRRAGVHGKQGSNVQQPSNLDRAFSKMSAMIPPPQNSSVSSDSGNVSDDEDWDIGQEPIEQAFSNPQSFHKERSGSPDSGHGSDDNVKPKSITPPRSTLKAEKPQVPTNPPNLRVSTQAPPAAQVNDVGLASSDMQKPSNSIDSICTLFGGKANPCQVQNVVNRGKSSSAPFLK